MNLSNSLYTKQEVEVVSSIFTVDKGAFKVLLIRGKNEEYTDKWSLVSGLLYNNETLEDGMFREIKYRTNIRDIQLIHCKNYSKVDRNPLLRAIAVSYVGILDIKKANLIIKDFNKENVLWFSIDDIPKLIFDHNEILNDSIDLIKKRIVSSDILRSLYPDGFTLPEIQKVYEVILNKELDRRNFRKRMLSLGLIYDTGQTLRFEGNKPAKLYMFKDEMNDKNVF